MTEGCNPAMFKVTGCRIKSGMTRLFVIPEVRGTHIRNPVTLSSAFKVTGCRIESGMTTRGCDASRLTPHASPNNVRHSGGAPHAHPESSGVERSVQSHWIPDQVRHDDRGCDARLTPHASRLTPHASPNNVRHSVGAPHAHTESSGVELSVQSHWMPDRVRHDERGAAPRASPLTEHSRLAPHASLSTASHASRRTATPPRASSTASSRPGVTPLRDFHSAALAARTRSSADVAWPENSDTPACAATVTSRASAV